MANLWNLPRLIHIAACFSRHFITVQQRISVANILGGVHPVPKYNARYMNIHMTIKITCLAVNNTSYSVDTVNVISCQTNLLLSLSAEGRRNGRDIGSCVRYNTGDDGIAGRVLLPIAEGVWNDDNTGGIRCVAKPVVGGILVPNELQHLKINRFRLWTKKRHKRTGGRRSIECPRGQDAQ